MKDKVTDISLAERVSRIKPSATLAIDAKAKKIQAQGGDIINLGVGEPDFDTPDSIKAAAVKAIKDGHTKYTAVSGVPELKKAICNKYMRDNQLEYEAKNIIASNGAKQAIYNLIQVLINPNDEVIIPSPYWVSYPDIVALAEGHTVTIKTTLEKHYKITAEQLSNAINDKTKLLILNSPSNPTGMSYTKEELQALGEVLRENPHVYILSDDIYEHIVWSPNNYCNILNVCPELKERTILINGVSKAYAMTGWRIGYAAGSETIIKAMNKIQSQSTSSPNSIAQYAAIEALNGDQQCIKDMVKKFKARHDFVLQGLEKISGIQYTANHGTFYTFPDCSDLIQSHKAFNNDIELAEFLLSKAGIAIVPGSAFGAPGCIRISYATNMEKLEDALKRMKTLLG
ncbi:MAG: aspartate aminotransferase [Legionellales bacterium]|nr:aspartate aminotransferase [Legionellales bacterium]|tara:strand:+ start:302 stop:1501 length:1200 start_codon:yes stop_codon:yes gene_type:complete